MNNKENATPIKRQGTSESATPKGRKMKKRSFNFTPKKLDLINDDVLPK